MEISGIFFLDFNRLWRNSDIIWRNFSQIQWNNQILKFWFFLSYAIFKRKNFFFGKSKEWVVLQTFLAREMIHHSKWSFKKKNFSRWIFEFSYQTFFIGHWKKSPGFRIFIILTNFRAMLQKIYDEFQKSTLEVLSIFISFNLIGEPSL